MRTQVHVDIQAACRVCKQGKLSYLHAQLGSAVVGDEAEEDEDSAAFLPGHFLVVDD